MVKKYAAGGGKYATSHTKIMGTNAEILFENILKKKNINFINANKNEETKEHWDYYIHNNQNILNGKYEIKSTKAKSRGQKPDYNILYIELQSVGGNKGWIYGGATFIAFEIPVGFLVFSRLDILNYISNIIQYMPLSKKSGQIGTLYTRKNRNDLVAIFSTRFLMEKIKHQIFSSNGEIYYYLPQIN